MFSILSWNIRQGGGSRTSAIYKKLISFDPSVMVLSEFHNNENGALIRSKLIQAGYIHQGVGHDKKNANTVLLASKFHFDLKHCREADPVYSSAILAAEFEAFILFGMYLPHKKKHRLFDYLIENIAGNKPAIITGDLNTGKNYIDQKGNSFMYEDRLIKMESMGFEDAFRLKHGQTKEYSWFSHQGNGYRYDHFYVDKALQSLVSECYYLHEWREEKLSDHSPMVLNIA